MAWQIDFDARAERELSRLAKPDRARILRFLADRIRPSPDPRRIGEALRGPDLGKYWKYRVGDVRLICAIQDAKLSILIVRIGHRREVYR